VGVGFDDAALLQAESNAKNGKINIINFHTLPHTTSFK
jgi:hypothetical protein